MKFPYTKIQMVLMDNRDEVESFLKFLTQLSMKLQLLLIKKEVVD